MNIATFWKFFQIGLSEDFVNSFKNFARIVGNLRSGS